MENKKKLYSNILARTLSTVILVPIVLYSIFKAGITFYLFLSIVALIMAFEWHLMIKNNKKPMWKIIGFIYIILPCISMIYLIKNLQGEYIIMWLLLTVWVSDVSAFFSGKFIGGPKLAPSISPNKTWAGMIGALTASSIVGIIAIKYFDPFSKAGLFTATILISLLSIIGDLIESALKRNFQIKDSSKIIPGHGGILDRIDGLILSAPMTAIITILFEDFIF